MQIPNRESIKQFFSVSVWHSLDLLLFWEGCFGFQDFRTYWEFCLSFVRVGWDYNNSLCCVYVLATPLPVSTTNTIKVKLKVKTTISKQNGNIRAQASYWETLSKRPEADSCTASVGAEYVGVKTEYSEEGTLRQTPTQTKTQRSNPFFFYL